MPVLTQRMHEAYHVNFEGNTILIQGFILIQNAHFL
jgi:hypothetical protein